MSVYDLLDRKNATEKTGAAMILIDTAGGELEPQLMNGLVRQHPFLAKYSLKNTSSGYIVGAFIARPNQSITNGMGSGGQFADQGATEMPVDYGSDPKIRIPIIASNGRVEPFDTFYDASNTSQPLTKVRVGAALSVSMAELSAPASLADKTNMAGTPGEFAISGRPEVGAPTWGKTASAEDTLVAALAARGAYTETVAAVLDEHGVRVKEASVHTVHEAPYAMLRHTDKGFTTIRPNGDTYALSHAEVDEIPLTYKQAAIEDGIAILSDGPGLPVRKAPTCEGPVKIAHVTIEGTTHPAIYAGSTFSLADGRHAASLGVLFADGRSKVASPDCVNAEGALDALPGDVLSSCVSLGDAHGRGHVIVRGERGYSASSPVTKVADVDGLHTFKDEVHAHPIRVAQLSFDRVSDAGIVWEGDGVVLVDKHACFLPTDEMQGAVSPSTFAKHASVDVVRMYRDDEDFAFVYQGPGGTHTTRCTHVQAKVALASLGDTEEGAATKLAAARHEDVEFMVDPDDIVSASTARTITVQPMYAAELLKTAAPTTDEVADLVWAALVHANNEDAHPALNKHAYAQPVSGRRTVDSVLALQFMNDNTMDKYLSMIPDLEVTVRKLADLLVASRLGLQVDSSRAASALKSLDRVLNDLKRVQAVRAYGDA